MKKHGNEIHVGSWRIIFHVCLYQSELEVFLLVSNQLVCSALIISDIVFIVNRILNGHRSDIMCNPKRCQMAPAILCIRCNVILRITLKYSCKRKLTESKFHRLHRVEIWILYFFAFYIFLIFWNLQLYFLRCLIDLYCWDVSLPFS